MSRHVFKSSFGQCKCRWCGKRYGDCKVTDEMRLAIIIFAANNGRTWRNQLNDAWARGDDVGAALQQVRNVVGPTGLLKIPAPLIELTREFSRRRGGGA